MRTRKEAILPDEIKLTPRLRYLQKSNYLVFLQEYQQLCNEKNKTR